MSQPQVETGRRAVGSVPPDRQRVYARSGLTVYRQSPTLVSTEERPCRRGVLPSRFAPWPLPQRAHLLVAAGVGRWCRPTMSGVVVLDCRPSAWRSRATCTASRCSFSGGTLAATLYLLLLVPVYSRSPTLHGHFRPAVSDFSADARHPSGWCALGRGRAIHQPRRVVDVPPHVSFRVLERLQGTKWSGAAACANAASAASSGCGRVRAVAMRTPSPVRPEQGSGMRAPSRTAPLYLFRSAGDHRQVADPCIHLAALDYRTRRRGP